MEQTFAMIKPSGIQRNLIGEIIKRIESKGLKINALKMIQVSLEQAKQHYDVHKEKPFFQDLISSIIDGPVIVMVVSGNNSVKIMRLLAGSTNPLESQPGTIRGDFSSDIRLNIIHTADAIERAKYEIGIYFNKDEIMEYEKSIEKYVYSK